MFFLACSIFEEFSRVFKTFLDFSPQRLSDFVKDNGLVFSETVWDGENCGFLHRLDVQSSGLVFGLQKVRDMSTDVGVKKSYKFSLKSSSNPYEALMKPTLICLKSLEISM